jgi:alpha-D-ribose 1-methylphosphonate 5-phosphate C-P lyase
MYLARKHAREWAARAACFSGAVWLAESEHSYRDELIMAGRSGTMVLTTQTDFKQGRT